VNLRKLVNQAYPESRVGGFSYCDASIAFYSQIDALLRPTDQVLDFGAGRGGHIIDDDVAYRRRLSNLRGRCAHVEGCDVDDAVLQNPFLDNAKVVEIGKSLPYPDDSFNLVLSRFVFEHIDDTGLIAGELLRVLKPGGYIGALTPNKHGYIAIGGSLVPNRLHVRMLERIQPGRKALDVFPTQYKLNTAGALRRAFPSEVDITISYHASEPAYFFGSSIGYRATKSIHKYLPDRLRPLLIIFIRKL